MKLNVNRNELARFETRVEKGSKLEANKTKGNAATFYKTENETEWRDRNGSPSQIYNDRSPSNPFHPEMSECYRDYALYSPMENADGSFYYERKKEKVVALRGLMVDLDIISDAHKKDGMTRDELEPILFGEAFKEAKWNSIVNTGNGYQVHFVFEPQFFSERESDWKLWEERNKAVRICLETEYGLKMDKGAKSLNCNYRIPTLKDAPKFNCKLMASNSDFNARKPVILSSIRKEVDSETTLKWIEECFRKYGEANSVPVPKLKSLHPETVKNLDHSGEEIRRALSFIPATSLAYPEWLSIGMALHSFDASPSGLGFHLFDEWSREDSRYREGETFSKWNSFSDGGSLSMGTLFYMAKENGYVPTVAKNAGKPFWTVPRSRGDCTPTLRAASEIAAMFKASGKFFFDGMGRLNQYHFEENKIREKTKMNPASIVSGVEELSTPVQINSDGVQDYASLNDKLAKDVFHSSAFQRAMPKIKTVMPCPVLNKKEDGTLEIISGYHEGKEMYCEGDPIIPPENGNDSPSILLELLSDFEFTTPGDKARAFSALLAPALLWGSLLPCRTPGVVIEANESQSGKGYLASIICEIYGVKPSTVSVKEKGAGSFEDSFSKAAAEGLHPVIQLDNMRGLVNSPTLESFMTENNWMARHAYSEEKTIDPTRHFILMTSNRAELTADAANRFCPVSIRRKPPNYSFRKWKEGGTLEHVRANRSKYLGAVYSILFQWNRSKKEGLRNEAGTAFRIWWETMDLICVHCGLARPSSGLNDTRSRMASPEIQFLRALALESEKQGLPIHRVKATRLLMLGVEWGIENQWTLGCPIDAGEENERTRMNRSSNLAKKLGQWFGDRTEKELDGFVLTMEQEWNSEKGREERLYSIRSKTPIAEEPMPLLPPPVPVLVPDAEDPNAELWRTD